MKVTLRHHGDLLLTLLALPCLALAWQLSYDTELLLLTLTGFVTLTRLLLGTARLWHQPVLLALGGVAALVTLAPLLALLGSFLLPDNLFNYAQWSALLDYWPGQVPFYSLRPSILLTLALLFLTLSPAFPSWLGVSAPILLAMAVMLTLAHLIEQNWFPWLHEFSLSPLSLLAILLLLLAEMAHQWPLRRPGTTSIALACSMSIMVVLLVLWHYHNSQNIRDVNQVARLRVNDLSEMLGREINVSDQAMQRFATSWDTDGGTPTSRVWTHRARRYAEHFNYLQTIAYIHRGGQRIMHAYPRRANQSLLGQHMLSPEDDGALLRAMTGKASTTGMVPLINGGRGVIFYLPIDDLNSGAVLGAAAFVVNPERLFASIDNTRDDSDFRIRVSHQGENLYTSTPGEPLSMLEHCNILQLGQSNFTLCAEASYSRLFEERSKLPAIVLVTGLIFTWMLYLLMYFHHRLRKRHNGVKDTNQRLRLEVEKRIALQQEVEWMARHDELTQLPNRRYFSQWVAASGTALPRSIVILDIDHFKQINDQLGHLVGDDYLQRVATCLRDIVESHGGLLARFGGEEFIACLPGIEPEKAADIGEQMRSRVEALQLSRHEPHTWVTISAGLVSTRRVNDCLEDLTQAADQALYRAKQNGRNRVETAGALDARNGDSQSD